jgi:hypothetical protein
MAMELVNGIPCFNCTDVERAQKAGTTGRTDQQDPLHPSDRISPNSNGTTDGASGLDSTTSSNATGVNAISSSTPLDVNQPLSSGDRGTQINIAV